MEQEIGVCLHNQRQQGKIYHEVHENHDLVHLVELLHQKLILPSQHVHAQILS